jgi:nicotinate-nucleotide pyrophosphorylase
LDGRVGGETLAEGTFLAKSSGVLAGLAVADLVFKLVDEHGIKVHRCGRLLWETALKMWLCAMLL